MTPKNHKNQHTSDAEALGLNFDMDSLEALFAQASSTEPELCDNNFTKMVLNSMPANPRRARITGNRTQSYFDIIAFLVGLLITYLVIEPATIMQQLISLLPNDISISLSSVVMLLLVFSAMAMGAWWNIEREPWLF